MTARYMPLQGLGGFERRKVRQSYYMEYATTKSHPFLQRNQPMSAFIPDRQPEAELFQRLTRQ